jgi:hypothetical protein
MKGFPQKESAMEKYLALIRRLGVEDLGGMTPSEADYAAG